MIDVVWILRDLWDCHFNLQEWVNHRFRNDNIVMVRRDTTDHVVTTEGLKFGLEGVEELGDLMTEYQFSDLKPGDVVLDLGANVGGFSIRAAQKVGPEGHVYAVEPLFYKELNENIARNNMQDRITVLTCALGGGDNIPLKYRDHSSIVPTMPLPTLIKTIGSKITFAKIDIEGAEWSIKPEDLAVLPRIEFEAHGGNNSCMPVNQNLLKFIRTNWDVKETHKDIPYDSFWIHAYPKEKTLNT